MKVLLIEDSRFLRLAIGRMLSKAGHDVTSVGDGQEGLEKAQQSHPDVVVLDMMLPTLEGTSVLRMLKKNPLTQDIPVIVLSGLSGKNAPRLKIDGAAAFLEKSGLDLNGDGSLLLAAIDALSSDSSDIISSDALASAAE